MTLMQIFKGNGGSRKTEMVNIRTINLLIVVNCLVEKDL